MAERDIVIMQENASGVFAWRTLPLSADTPYLLRVNPSGVLTAEQVYFGHVVGVGADYAITNAFARVDFGTTDIDAALPAAGTYMIGAMVQVLNGALTNDHYELKLRDITAGADVPGSLASLVVGVANEESNVMLTAPLTVTQATTIQVFVQNTVGARGSVIAAESSIWFHRIA